jgi:hypothetical protein
VHLSQIRITLVAVLTACLTIAACSAENSSSSRNQDGENKLAVGKAAKVNGEISVPTRWADEYNYHTRAEILDLRKRYVAEVPTLLAAPYVPLAPIFQAIEDRKPWWGLAGRSVWGRGQRSIEGLAEESRFMSNPYLLAGADPASANIWNKDKITADDLANPDFPYAWHIKSLHWRPQESMAEVIYLVSEFNDHMNDFREKLLEQSIVPAFNIAAYNARDFGYNYIWLDEKSSQNIVNVNHPAPEAAQIVQMIHCGGTCGYVGNCNNMSPHMKSIDCIKYTSLPARAKVLLWKEKPGSITQTPDFIFYITLE